MHGDVPNDVAETLDDLAKLEPPSDDFRAPPKKAERYLELLRDFVEDPNGLEAKLRETDGPKFAFPSEIPRQNEFEIVRIESEELLNHHMAGWKPGEIAAGSYPVMGIVSDGYPVSVCFCAKRSKVAAEAGIETAEAFRGRGYAPIVAAAWAQAIRAEGLIPLYSTSWNNHASLAVARKLGLVTYASIWNIG